MVKYTDWISYYISNFLNIPCYGYQLIMVIIYTLYSIYSLKNRLN